MKLLLAIIDKDDRSETERRLTEEGFRLTVVGTTGGFLKRKNVTLLIGVADGKVSRVREILKSAAGKRSMRYYQSPTGQLPVRIPTGQQPTNIESESGGCTVFEIPCDKIDKF